MRIAEDNNEFSRIETAATGAHSLIIFDSIFPHLLSAFRIAEYNSYLAAFKDAWVYSTAQGFPLIGETRSFGEVLEEYGQFYPQFKDRVALLDDKTEIVAKLIYTVFLSYAFRFIEVAEKANVPFIFTLYPGGTFELNESESDAKLRRVCASPNLKKIIVTQKATRDYLNEHRFCDPSLVSFIYGGVFPTDRLRRTVMPKRRYKAEKDSFDICFVAHKYTMHGRDKGYDIFIDVAKRLARAHDDIFFHVVGQFNESDIEVSDIKDRIMFYGVQVTDFFSKFYSRIDLILSPNVPFIARPGSFDGFPTGCCIEAGTCGVAVFCTDPLNQNIAFEDGREIIIVPRNAEEICAIVEHYYRNYDLLYELAERGRAAFERVFDLSAQMRPRLELLAEYIK